MSNQHSPQERDIETWTLNDSGRFTGPEFWRGDEFPGPEYLKVVSLAALQDREAELEKERDEAKRLFEVELRAHAAIGRRVEEFRRHTTSNAVFEAISENAELRDRANRAEAALKWAVGWIEACSEIPVEDDEAEDHAQFLAANALLATSGAKPPAPCSDRASTQGGDAVDPAGAARKGRTVLTGAGSDGGSGPQDLRQAVRETLCDDATCSRCRHLQDALDSTQPPAPVPSGASGDWPEIIVARDPVCVGAGVCLVESEDEHKVLVEDGWETRKYVPAESGGEQ